MPCDGSHMDPTRAEENSRHLARLLIYVHNFLRLDIPPEVKAASENFYGDADRVDEFAASLCALIRGTPDKERERLVYNARAVWSRRLADWWEAHQRADEKRITREKEKAYKKAIARIARAKLTEEERDALGID